MTSPKSAPVSKAIPAILKIAGVINNAVFTDSAVNAALQQFNNGDVVPVLATLIELTKGKFTCALNKKSTENLVANVKKSVENTKSNFKAFGFAVALAEAAISNEAIDGETFCNIAKSYSDDLKTAHEASKPVTEPKAKLSTITSVNSSGALAMILSLLPTLSSEDLTTLEIQLLLLAKPVQPKIQKIAA